MHYDEGERRVIVDDQRVATRIKSIWRECVAGVLCVPRLIDIDLKRHANTPANPCGEDGGERGEGDDEDREF